jgi:hypothetical protein
MRTHAHTNAQFCPSNSAIQDLAEFFKFKTPGRLFAELALSPPGAPIKAAVETVRTGRLLTAHPARASARSHSAQPPPNITARCQQALKFAIVPGVILGETLPVGESTLTSLEGSTIKVGPSNVSGSPRGTLSL